MYLTDGKGNLSIAAISDPNKKHCAVEIIETDSQEPPAKKIIIALSLLKNNSRFEWFLEKATEIGVSEIIPLICVRTEKEKFRFDRMKGICISAMLQSQQAWLPVLHEPVLFDHLVMRQFDNCKKMIAHCSDGERQLIHDQIIKSSNQLILIGPEGDFTKDEIDKALNNEFIPVTLGKTRLRSETAGIVASCLLSNSLIEF